MPRSLRWRNLVGGVVALLAVAAVAVAILKFARIGALRGDTYQLYTYTNEARGILENSDVWLAGQRVGIVERIEFRPVRTDTAKRIRLTLKIQRKHQELIRSDAYAQIRSGGRLLGEPVVYITMGTESHPPLADESVLASRDQADTESFTSEIAGAARDFPAIARSAKEILGQARALASRLDAVGSDEPGVAFRLVRSRAQRLTSGTDTGTIGLFLADSVTLTQRLRRILARTDSLGARFQESARTFASFSSDSGLGREIADVRNEISIVRVLVSEAHGTAGRLMFDRAIPERLMELEKELARLMEDIRREPARYIIH